MDKEKEIGLVDKLKLKGYLAVERAIQNKLAGNPNPWPGRMRWSLAALAAVGLFSFAFSKTPDLIRSLAPSDDICANPEKFTISDSFERVSLGLRLPLAHTVTLDSSNRFYTTGNIGIYNNTDLKIVVNPPVIRSVLDRELVGAVIPNYVPTIFILGSVAFVNEEHATNYLHSFKPEVDKMLENLKKDGKIGEEGLAIVGAVPVFDEFNRARTLYPIKSQDQFISQLSREILNGIRIATINGLKKGGLISKDPESSPEALRRLDFAGLRVSAMPRSFIDTACKAGSYTGLRSLIFPFSQSS